MKRPVPAAVSAMVFATACSATSFSPAEQANGCEAYVAAQLAHGDRCRDTNEVRTGLPGRKERVAACGKSVAAAGNGVTPTMMSDCATALKNASCEQNEVDVGACRAMLEATGGTELGVLCTFGTQCKTGFCSGAVLGDEGVRCGNCVEPVAVGLPCDQSRPVPCVRGAGCVVPSGVSGTGGTCTQYLGEGNACDGVRALCGSGLYCGAATKICKRRGATSMPCDPKDAFPCAGALVCISGKCSVRLPSGAACGNELGECDVLLRCSGGTCTAPAPAKLGALCEGTTCTPDAACLSQVCVARKALGVKCDAKSDVCVQNAACLGGVCVIPDPGICK